MSRYILGALIVAGLWSSNQNTYAAAATYEESPVVSDGKRIAIAPDAMVCASVTVAQDLWSDSLDAQGRVGLSDFLVNSLRREFNNIGRLGDPTRFRTNDNDSEPLCKGDAPVYVNIFYNKLAEEMSFSSTVEVVYKYNKFTLDYDKNISEEIKSGRLIVLYGQSEHRKALVNDIIMRSREIVSKVSIL